MLVSFRWGLRCADAIRCPSDGLLSSPSCFVQNKHSLMSEYDPLIPRLDGAPSEDLERVQERFGIAARPYLSSPIPWLAWAIVLPGAALATPGVAAGYGAAGVLFLWSIAVLVGGSVEGALILRRRGRGTTPLASWVLRLQGNQSLIAVALSAFLLWQDLAAALPGVWLLLVGNSFFLLGGLAFRPMRQVGVLYEVAGLLALWPAPTSLWIFAVATALGNLRIAWALMRR